MLVEIGRVRDFDSSFEVISLGATRWSAYGFLLTSIQIERTPLSGF